MNARMDNNDLQELALRLAAFTDLLEQRADRVADITEANAHAVESAAVTLTEQGRDLSASAISAIRDETRNAMQALHADIAASRSAQRRFATTASLALVVAAAIAAAGSAWMVWRSQQELKRAEFAQGILEATRSGAITMCGDQVCVRVGDKPKRANADGYVIAE
ncbi:hypothetical protein [Solilutibacter silvestris]|uniref:hypothetical protein n=1 Tax=Solilutibacter silvestris TaxID=1645665 RepID=UPI003D3503AD